MHVGSPEDYTLVELSVKFGEVSGSQFGDSRDGSEILSEKMAAGNVEENRYTLSVQWENPCRVANWEKHEY